jgi:hypothetical protein
MRQLFRTIAEAEIWARSIGVGVDYDDRLDIAHLCNEVLTQLMERSLDLPDRIEIDIEIFRTMGKKAVEIPASANQGRIAVNPAASYWRQPDETAAELRRFGFWSSDNPLHPLYHEAEHVLFYKANHERDEELRDLRNAQKTIVAGEVSQWACLNVHEFLAEVFAGLMAGRTFSKDIIRWYRTRRGIMP